MKKVKILSDYTSESSPNLLNIVLDDQGDVHISLFVDPYNAEEMNKSVRIAASGTRHSAKVRKALYDFVEAYLEELKETNNEAIKKFNR